MKQVKYVFINFNKYISSVDGNAISDIECIYFVYFETIILGEEIYFTWT